MQFYSTNNKNLQANLKEAVLKGLPSDNGLFMPLSIPKLSENFLGKLQDKTFLDIAIEVSQLFLSEYFTSEEIENLCKEAFSFPVPLVEVEEGVFSLELFHGPTLAFKDFGARFMSRVMAGLHNPEEKPLRVLVATSGDTGSAVAQGFLGVEGVTVTILYPKGKVSHIQEQQLTTNGQNIEALEIDGTFDDCQALVKKAFLDEELTGKYLLTSANSINIARLIPQSLYYIYAVSQLLSKKEPLHFCVPSGNFGNVTGGLLAREMGVPIDSLSVATNANKVVPDYLSGATFHPKPSVATISNAMDVGNPSNFPRMQDLFGQNEQRFRSELKGYHFTDDQTKSAIAQVYTEHNYLLCPHSAIGYLGLKEHLKNRSGLGIFLATAHPIKFQDIVEPVIGSKLEVPERLQKIIERKKSAINLSTDYQSFKKHLLGST